MIVVIGMLFHGLDDPRFFLLQGEERVVFGAGESAAGLFVRKKCDEQKSENEAEKNGERDDGHGVDGQLILSASFIGGLRSSCPIRRISWRVCIPGIGDPVF